MTEKFECQNCGSRWTADELDAIEDVHERVGPGEPMPAGECPGEDEDGERCGAVCHLVTPLEAMNPEEWPDPDQVDSSECRVIYGFCLDAWNNAGKRTDEERRLLIQSSLETMRDEIAALLQGVYAQSERRAK